MLAWPLLLTMACTGRDAPELVVLVSLDTTRADAIGAYGLGEAAKTPFIDRLAVEGVRFQWALAQAPTTLSSHTAALSGVDRNTHRVVRNGFPVPADVPLLQERFSAKGWNTIGVVGSSALAPDMGLARGFGVYDDLDTGVSSAFETPCPLVVDAGLAHLDRRDKGDPTFLFVHLYDPHQPWDSAPEILRRAMVDPKYKGRVDSGIDTVSNLADPAFLARMGEADRAQARALYQAEVAWADVCVGQLMGGLSERALLGDAVVAIMSDHGEMLGEQGRWGHGADIDLAAIHVPLILWSSGERVPKGAVVGDVVRNQDIASTLAGLGGLNEGLGEGRDLRPVWEGRSGTAPSAFAEATRPHAAERSDAWNNLDMERGVVADGHLLVRQPFGGGEDQLYLVAEGQPTIEDAAWAGRLREQLRAWDDAAPAHRSVDMDAATIEALRALGYTD